MCGEKHIRKPNQLGGRSIKKKNMHFLRKELNKFSHLIVLDSYISDLTTDLTSSSLVYNMEITSSYVFKEK